MKKILIHACVLGLLSAAPVAYAHELATHGALTWQAYQRSALVTDSTRLRDLGIDPTSVNPLGGIYYDVSGGQVRERRVDDFEGTIIERRLEQLGATPLSIPGWLMRGAIREDDATGEDNPQDDPFNQDLKRPLHHFYDPVFNRPLSVPGLSLIDADVHRAPDWAVGSRDVFAQPNTPEANRRNHFTIFDAREAMYRALTGRDSQGNPLQLAPGGTLTKQSDLRNAYWATTFRALGDALHLNQDVAQPQHTRNDPHSGKGPGIVQSLLTGHESVFEKYIEARATGARSFQIDGTPVAPEPLNYGGYPIPAFTKYSDFWSTRDGVSGRGLADYSNRGFFSAGTNLGSNPYTSPSNDAASYTKESATGLLPTKPLQKLNFLRGDVPDTLNAGSSANIRLTTESVFDLFLVTTPPTYNLNRFNYDDKANLLIPRAVAYSAGLVNYFFRGRIDFVPDPNNTGQYLIRNLGGEPMKGKFRLYYDDQDSNRNPVRDSGGQELVWDTEVILTATEGVLAAGASLPVPGFVPPSTPPPKTPGEYMLVFSGDMGEEKAEAGSVGAIVAKQIRNEYKGALYVLGVDADGVITSLRADRDGTKVLSGWDISRRDANNPNGVFVPPSTNVFDPLGLLYGSSIAKPVRDKIHAYKQVEYGPGPIEYTATSVTLISPDNPNALRSHYGAGLGRVSFGQVIWIARSPDDQIGTFEFQIVNIRNVGRDADIQFTRRFKDTSGASRVEIGGTSMPTLTFPFSYQLINGSSNPSSPGFPLVISDDGLTIKGFATFGSLNTRILARLVISLAQTPQIRLEQTTIAPIVSGSDFFPTPPFQPAAPCSVEFRRSPDGVLITTTANGFVRNSNNSFESSLTEEVLIGNLGGRIATYMREQLVKRTEVVDESICYAEGSDFDPATGLQRQKYSIRNTANNDVQISGGTFERLVGGDYSLPSPNVPNESISMGQLKEGYPGSPFLCRDCQWSEIYDGFDPVPSVQITQNPGVTFRREEVGRNVVRALTDRHADVIYGESASGTQAFIRKFRNIILTGKEYVADSSPLGEVFFATSDKSDIIHQTVPGGMPQVRIPENVVELLAVVWM